MHALFAAAHRPGSRRHALAVALALAIAAAAIAASPAAPAGDDGLEARLGSGLAADSCPIFRHGFETLANTIFRDGFEAEGHLQPFTAGAPITYTSTGGYRIQIDRHTINLRDPLGMNRVEHWGDPHENLNGKHIKDWGGAPGWDERQRTIVLGDGTKVTMSSAGAQGVTLHTSIYDGRQNVQIDNCTNTVLHYSADAADTGTREAAQHDGETARFTTDAGTAIATYTNIYNEDAGFQITPLNAPLGATGGFANPNQVNDFFDDPRLGHT